MMMMAVMTDRFIKPPPVRVEGARTGLKTPLSFNQHNPGVKPMTLKPMTVTAGAILALVLSGQAWTGDVKTMAADATKDQATEIAKDKGKAMLPKTGVAPAATDPTKVVPTATDPTKVVPTATDPTKVVPTATDPTKVVPTATDPTKVVPTATDPTKAAKEKTIEMGKDKATDTIKGVVK
jgi:hypothetical protein